MTVEEYLAKLKKALQGSDSALIQDALSDSEEYLRSSLGIAREGKPGLSESEALRPIIEKFGAPEEVAAAFRGLEARSAPVSRSPLRKPRTFLGKYFGVLTEAPAWSAFLYFLLCLLTGCFFGMWTLMGTGLSLLLLPLIIGLPIVGVFLLSVRALTLVEGRIVETLLGVRMPRRPIFVRTGLSAKQKFLSLVADPQTWKGLAYLFLQLPLGWAYAVLMIGLLGLSIKSILYPVWFFLLHRPLITLSDSMSIRPAGWLSPAVILLGCLLFPLTLHLAKKLGLAHGRYAKTMLVKRIKGGTPC